MQTLMPQERQRLIAERLSTEGRVVAAELARELGVSEDTVRRDLRELAAAGGCRRVYGGALPVAPQFGDLADRQARAPAAKIALAETAARLVEPGSIVFIDAGSSNVAVARALPAGQGLTVVTNAPEVAVALIGRAGTDVVLIGGRIDPQVGGSLGGKAIRDAREIRSDLCFLGACGVDAVAGVTAFDDEDAEFKRTIAALARRRVVAATGNKLGTAASFIVAAAHELDVLVVEHDADLEACAAFEGIGVRVLRAAAPA